MLICHISEDSIFEQCSWHAGKLILETWLGIPRMSRDNQQSSKHDNRINHDVAGFSLDFLCQLTQCLHLAGILHDNIDKWFVVHAHHDWVADFLRCVTRNLVGITGDNTSTMIEWPTSSAVSHVILSASLATTPVPMLRNLLSKTSNGLCDANHSNTFWRSSKSLTIAIYTFGEPAVSYIITRWLSVSTFLLLILTILPNNVHDYYPFKVRW